MSSECIKLITVLDVQWSDCREDVKEDVRNLWRYHELGMTFISINGTKI